MHLVRVHFEGKFYVETLDGLDAKSSMGLSVCRFAGDFAGKRCKLFESQSLSLFETSSLSNFKQPGEQIEKFTLALQYLAGYLDEDFRQLYPL